MALDTGEYTFIISMALMLVFAVVSNILVIVCVGKFSRLRTATNVLVANLSVSDILLAGFVIPQRLHDISHDKDFYEGVILCKIVNFFPVFVITSSIYSLVGISFDRKRAIMESQKRQLTTVSVFKILPILWVFSLLVSVPTMIEYTVTELFNTVTIQATNETNATSYTMKALSCGSRIVSFQYGFFNVLFILLISYVIPLALIIKNYAQLVFYIWKKGRQIGPGHGGRQNFVFYKHRLRLVKMMTLAALIFALSWLPYFVVLLIAKLNDKDGSEAAAGFLNMFLIAMATFSTTYNVLLYTVFNINFRLAFKTLLLCKKVKDRFRHASSNVGAGGGTIMMAGGNPDARFRLLKIYILLLSAAVELLITRSLTSKIFRYISRKKVPGSSTILPLCQLLPISATLAIVNLVWQQMET